MSTLPRRGNDPIRRRYSPGKVLLLDRRTKPQGPFAVVQIAKKFTTKQRQTSKLFKPWRFPIPIPSAQVIGLNFHCVSEEDYVRSCLVIEDDSHDSSVFEVLPYNDWWILF